jgi:imidazolonepropionase-like amidohydrolase
VLADQVILIEDKRITAVGRDVTIPSGAAVIDLSDATVLPGLIDVHTHLTYDPVLKPDEVLALSHPRLAILAAMNARSTLLAGFTTVRDAGAEGYADVAVREGSNAGTSRAARVRGRSRIGRRAGIATTTWGRGTSIARQVLRTASTKCAAWCAATPSTASI